MATQEWYSLRAAAKTIDVSRQTFYKWIRRGKITIGLTTRDGRMLFTAEEIERVKAGHQRHPRRGLDWRTDTHGAHEKVG